MAAKGDRRHVRVSAGAQREHIADLVQGHATAERFRFALEPGSNLRIVRGQGLAVDTALGRAADGSGLHQARPQPVWIDTQVAGHMCSRVRAGFAAVIVAANAPSGPGQCC